MLHIDGTTLFGELSGSAKAPPFYVFDDERQDWIAGPFRWRWCALLWRWRRG